MKVALDIPLEIISDKTSLPSGTKIVSLADFLNQTISQVNDLEIITYLDSINRRQQAYFSEKGNFSQNLNNLGWHMKREIQNYVFNIFSQSNPQRVMIVGQPKSEGIKTYVGLVYAIKIVENNMTIKKICETNQPFSKFPQIPKLPKNSTTSEDIQCPPGFE